MPSRAIREQIVSALHLIVHVRRFEDGVRRLESIAEIVGMEGTTPQLQDIFRFERRGLKGRQIAGEFVATGIVPRVVEELHERGIEIRFSRKRNRVRKSEYQRDAREDDLSTAGRNNSAVPARIARGLPELRKLVRPTLYQRPISPMIEFLLLAGLIAALARRLVLAERADPRLARSGSSTRRG